MLRMAFGFLSNTFTSIETQEVYAFFFLQNEITCCCSVFYVGTVKHMEETHTFLQIGQEMGKNVVKWSSQQHSKLRLNCLFHMDALRHFFYLCIPWPDLIQSETPFSLTGFYLHPNFGAVLFRFWRTFLLIETHSDSLYIIYFKHSIWLKRIMESSEIPVLLTVVAIRSVSSIFW